MPKPIHSSDVVTKAFVRSEINATKTFVKDEINTTKAFVGSEINSTKALVKNELKKVDDKAKQYRDDVLNKLDEVMGELETIREDNIIGNYQSKNLSKKVGDHEKRIEILEQSA